MTHLSTENSKFTTFSLNHCYEYCYGSVYFFVPVNGVNCYISTSEFDFFVVSPPKSSSGMDRLSSHNMGNIIFYEGVLEVCNLHVLVLSSGWGLGLGFIIYHPQRCPIVVCVVLLGQSYQCKTS